MSEAVVANTKYLVDQSMVRRGRPVPLPIRIVLFLVALGISLPIAPFWYILMLSKSISQRSASILVPAVMPLMDKAYGKVKVELLKGLHGRVLDVGCGAGDWLKYFSKASHITELEPNRFLIPKIQANVERFKEENPKVSVDIVNGFVSDLDPSNPYDYVVFGNVMCEVPDQEQFLKDVDRVLKPGGIVVFQEHIRRPDGTFFGYFQDVFNSWWKVASDGCNCNRRTVSALKKMKNWNVTHWELESDGPPWLDYAAMGLIEKVANQDVVQSSLAKM